MSRIVVSLAAGTLFIASQAIAQEKVSFPSTDADLKGGTPTTITGYLYKPAGGGPFGAVVGMHGCGGIIDTPPPVGGAGINPLNGQWGEILASRGYLVLWIDSLRSRGQVSMCGVPASAAAVLPDREMPRDAFGAMNYLRSRSDVRPNSIAIMGQSYGGAATLFTIADGVLPKDIKDFRAAIVLYPGCVRIKNEHWRPRVPTLLLMGELDNVAFAPPCKELIAQVKEEGGSPIDAHFYPDTYHIFDHPNLPKVVNDLGWILASNPEARADAINRVTQFLAKQLQ
jgi:dienelactone hydrolase